MTLLLIAKVTILFAAALAIAMLAARAAAATRHAILAGAQLAALALPILTPFVPPLAILPAAKPARAIATAPAPGIESAETVAPAPRPRPARNPLPWIWMAGVAAIATRKLAGYARAIRIVRKAAALLPQSIRFSDEIEQPSTFGRWILLPRAAREWSPERLSAVLLHERAHVARHDTLVALIGDAACALYWFHPLAWLVARRTRLERERACDDRVLASGVGATEYAAAMIDVARSVARPHVAAMPMAERSQLEQRLRAILDPATCRRSAYGAAALAAIVLAAPLLAALHGAVPRPASIEPGLLGDDVASPYSERVGPPAPSRIVEARGPDAALIALFNAEAARPPRQDIDFVPERARWALTQIRNGELVEPLIESLRHHDWRIRAYAAWALGKSADDRAVAPIIPLLDEPIWRVRAMAAHALANLADRESENAMLAHIDDPAWQVRTEVVRYLQNIGGHREKITAMRTDRHSAVRATARN